MKIIQYFTLLISVFLSSVIWAQEDFNLLELYKDLHSNPELSYKEEETSKKLASLLSGLGML